MQILSGTRRRGVAYTLGLALIAPLVAACGGAPAAPAATTAPAPAAATTAPAAPAAATAAPAAATAAPAAATAAPAAATTAPAAAPTGDAGTLRMLYWQAPTILNPHQAQGTKDSDAATVILESLARWNEKGEPVPFLAAEIPTKENGGIAADNLSITWKLKPNLKWSDGSALTADDVVFTWQYCSNPETACTSKSNYDPIKEAVAVDPQTVKITWKEANPTPYVSFVGYYGAPLQKKQFEKCIGTAALKDAACLAANNNPMASGAYMVKDFKPGDTVVYEKNPNYYNAANVAFTTVEIKGGGDAVSAARAVCETGEVDYAWNLQVAKALIDTIGKGGKCDLIVGGSTGIERMVVNFANPDPTLGENRSEPDQPNPILTDKKVREAINKAMDRKAIVEQVYGIGGRVTCNSFTQPANLNSPNTTCDKDVEGAKKLLDEAGWVAPAGGGTREKDGKKLVLTYATTINAVRQSVQAIVKANLAAVGIELQLKAIDSTVFFSTDAGNPDTFGKFYNDLQMYTNSPDSPDPTSYLVAFTCEKVASKANNWQFDNNGRYCNAEYDAIVASLQKEFDPAKRAELAIQANDFLVGDFAIMPLVDRSTPEGKSTTLTGPTGTTFDSVLWNIASWKRG